MGKLILDISMSLDGFIAGHNISEELPMGESGPLLHNWFFADKEASDEKIISELVQNCGAVILGSTTYHTAIDGAWEGKCPFDAPAFVLSRSKPATVVDGFTFVDDGIIKALARAKAVAKNKNVWIMGGANVAQQYIQAGLLDELRLHIAPVLLGGGTSLFGNNKTKRAGFIKVSAIETKCAIHLVLRPVKSFE